MYPFLLSLHSLITPKKNLDTIEPMHCAIDLVEVVLVQGTTIQSLHCQTVHEDLLRCCLLRTKKNLRLERHFEPNRVRHDCPTAGTIHA